LIPLLFYVIPPLFDIDYADTPNGFANNNLGFVSLLILISGALFAGDAVSSEFEKKTGLLLFPTPQKRTSIYMGKYVAALIATIFIVTLYYLITVLEMAQIYGVSGIEIEVVKSYFIATLYAASVISLIFFFSCILKGTISSTLIGFFLLMMIMPITSAVLTIADVEPWFLVTYSAGLITSILGFVAPLHGPREDENPAFQPELITGIFVMLAYALFFFFISIMIANRKRME